MSQEVTAPVDTTEAPAPDNSMVEIQRREKALRIRENKLKQEVESERSKLLEELKAAPLAKLQELGISAEHLADQLLNGKTEPEDLTKKELREIKEQLAAQKRAEQDKMVAEYKRDVLSHVEKAPDTYELINNHRDGKKLYWDSVVAYYEEYGETPKYEEIADKVEKELFEHGQALFKLKKFQATEKIESTAEAIAAEVKSEEKPKKEKEHPVKKKPSATISNTLTASSAPSNRITIQSSATMPHYTSKLAQMQAERLAKVLGK